MQSSAGATGSHLHSDTSPSTLRREEQMDVSSRGSSALESTNSLTEVDSTSSKTFASPMSSMVDTKSSQSPMSSKDSSSVTTTSAMSSMVGSSLTSTPRMSSLVGSSKSTVSTMSSMVASPSSSNTGSSMDVSTVEGMFKALDISVTSASDEKCPDPDDCTVLEFNGAVVLIFTDYINESVRAIYQHKGNIHTSTRSLNHRPHSVARLTDTKIAVCYWMHNQITIMKISEEIEHDKNIITRKDYNCVAPLGKGDLVAGCSEQSCVDIINKSGTILKTFDTYKDRMYYIMNKPRSMCIRKDGHIVVTDGGSKSVYCLTRNGKILFQYSPDEKDRQLHWPRGVVMTELDDILFADCYTDKVIQLSSSGGFIRDVLTSRDGISHPHGLCIHGHDLYVTQEENNIVKKFDISGIEFQPFLETSKM